MNAEQLCELLHLSPLVGEGGRYRRTYISDEHALFPSRGERELCSCILYMYTPETFSRFHRLPTDEIYHFYLGAPVELFMLHADGQGERVVLGPDIEKGQRLQLVVPRGAWQGSRMAVQAEYSLVGTTMAPAYGDDDYENASEGELIEKYPNFSDVIKELCREPQY